ncbi:MAG: hypothetical protein H6625_01280 [Bdellovibrionaceae bacterium]|nr:hypothetical protein [Pseudobdellovibrionaceae bacterium]
MTFFKKTILYLCIFNLSFFPALQALAEQPTFSMTPFGAPEPTNGLSIKGEMNYYKSIGLDGIPDNVTQQQIKAGINFGFPEVLETKNISNYDQLIKTTEGRKLLIRQLNQALNLLAQSSGKNLLADFIEVYKADSEMLKNWNQKQNGGKWSAQVLSENATVRSLYSVVKGNLNADHINKSKLIYREAVETLSSPKMRYTYDIKNGFRTFQASEGLLNNVTRRGSQLHVKVVDPDTGKKVNVKLDLPTQDQLLKFKVSDLAKDVMSGTFKYSALSGAILTLVHAISYYKLMTDYANNPRVVEDSFDENVNLLYFTSIATFFLGAKLADWSLFRRNINYARQLVTEKKIFSNKPLEVKKAKLTSMANLSYAGIGTGLLASMLVHQGGKHLLSCLPLFNERPIKERPLSATQKDDLNKMCDQAWVDYVLSYKYQFLLVWAALANAKSLMTLGQVTGTAGYRYWKTKAESGQLKTYREHLKDVKTQRTQHLEVVGRGTKITSIRAVLLLGLRSGAQLIVTIGLVYGFIWTFDKIYSAYTIHKPVTTNYDKLKKAINALNFTNWDIHPDQCDENQDNCGAQKYVNDFAEYQSSLDKWRTYNFRDVSEAMSNWTEYYAKAMNYYKASKYFYKDLITQFAERKRMATAFQPKASSREGYLSQNYYQYSDEILPLFRSSPFFGLKSSEPILPLNIPVDVKWNEYVRSFPLDLLKKNNTIYIKTLQSQGEKLKTEFNFLKDKISKLDIDKYLTIIDKLTSNNSESVYNGYFGLLSLAQSESESCQYADLKNLDEDKNEDPYTGNLAYRCLAYKNYMKLSNSKIWRDKQFPFQAGYKMNNKDNLTGGKPLASGNEYLINYETRFQLKEIDSGWYEEEFLGKSMRSMSEYLILSAACGPRTAESFSDPWWGFSPKFTPPKLLFKTKFDICTWYVQQGHKNPDQLWHYIPNNQDGKVYAGIIDFLYQEINDSLLNETNFDSWWDLNVRPNIEKSIINSNAVFNKEIVQDKLPEALLRDDKSSDFWKYIFAGNPQDLGYIPSITSEIGLYFNDIFRPMLDIFNISYRNFDSENTQKNIDKYKHFEMLKDDFYNQLHKLSGYKEYGLDDLRKIQLDATLALNKLRVFYDSIKYGRVIEDLIYVIESEIEEIETQLEKSDEQLVKIIPEFNADVRKVMQQKILSNKETLAKLEAGINKTNNPVLQYKYYIDLDVVSGKPILNPNTGKPLEYSEQQKIPTFIFNQIELNIWNLTNLLMAVTHIDQIQKEL